MILDSSAVVTLLLRHSGHELFFEALASADALRMGAPTLTETGIVLAARLSLDPTPLLGRFVQEYGVDVILSVNLTGGKPWMRPSDSERGGTGRG